ncbi:MAG TPA: hypothetical protein VM889_08540 [Candidatus Thermoplasmatota archaeon]|nr:hypothetical protein [Candidatus Thermoplasmatota archaeon]
MRAIATIVLVVLILASVPATALDRVLDVAYEIGEPDALVHEGRGQHTCLAAASSLALNDARCPLVPTGGTAPANGVVVLDSVYRSSAGLSNQRETISDPEGRLREQQDEGTTSVRADPLPIEVRVPTGLAVGGDTNTRRDSGGDLPDLILPGLGKFEAWYGWWNDLDGDGLLEYRDERQGQAVVARPDNEWSIKKGATILAWVEPGAHPGYAAHDRPGSASPDFYYSVSGITYNSVGNGQHIFLGGSLLGALTVLTVNDATLAPSEFGPYTPGPESRVDLDRYVAVLPGPLDALYRGTVGPDVDAMGSPSSGSLVANGGRVTNPPDATGTALDGPLAFAAGAAYGRYEHETDSDAGSTASGRHADFVAGYRGWIDLLPRYGYASTGAAANTHVFPGEMPGRDADGRLAAPPGFVSFEVRTGLWRDLDADGWIGTASADPYEGGLRPNPDDYVETRGEFFPLFVTSHPPRSQPVFAITLTPDGPWDAVIANGVRIGGSETITLLARGVDRNPGVYRSDSIFMPRGTMNVAFTACTETLGLRYEDPATGPSEAVLRDCDLVGNLAVSTIPG